MKKLVPLVVLLWSIVAQAATLPLVGGSPTIGPDGRWFRAEFSLASPSSRTNPTISTARPTLTTGSRSLQPEPIGAWYVDSGGVTTWTLWYNIPEGARAVYGENFTVSWSAALATDGSSNTTPTSATGVAVLNKSRTDSNGWYAVPAASDARQIYVSPTGSDANPGTQAQPKGTPAGGMSLMRSGFPDRLYLERGGTYPSFLTAWQLNGRGPTEPIIVGAYGSGARPIISASGGQGFGKQHSQSGDQNRRYIALIGLDFQQSGSVGTSNGLWWLGGGTDIWVEDCRFSNFGEGVTVQGFNGFFVNDLVIRRSQIVDASVSGGKSQGLYLHQVVNAYIAENIIDRNGYIGTGFGTSSIFNHNLYTSTESRGTVFYENISTRAGSDGVKLRSGGLIFGNFFLRNPINIKVGWDDADDPAPWTSGQALIAKNVIIGASDILPASSRGWGIVVANGVGGGVVDNLVANATGTQGTALHLDGTYFTIGINGFDVRNNTFYEPGNDNGGAVMFEGNGTQLRGVAFTGNIVDEDGTSEPLVRHFSSPVAGQFREYANNKFNGSGGFLLGSSGVSFSAYKTAVGDSTSTQEAVDFADSTWGIDDYMTAIGGTGTEAAFYTAIRGQRNGAWASNLTARAIGDSFRQKFSDDAGSPVPPAPTGLTGARTTTTVTVSFPAVSGATGYKIRRLSGSGGSVSSSQTVTNPTATFTSLTGSTTYYFNALATNGTGDSSASAELAVRTAPAVITGLGATAGESQVTFAWTQSADSNWRQYRVYTSATEGGTYTLHQTITSARATVSAVVPGDPETAIWAKVTQVDNTGAESDLSAAASETPTAPILNAVPIANAGVDITVTDTDRGGTEAVQLDGRASVDPDGTIVSYSWSEGGTVKATGSFPKVTLGIGVHTFTLTVTDDDGATDTDTVTMTVEEGPIPNNPPTCSISSYGSVQISNELATTLNILIDPDATDSDGTVVSLVLKKNGVVVYNIENDPDEVATVLAGFSHTVGLGTSVFTLAVTDDDGATCTSTGTITVLPYVGPDPNEPPVVSAGGNRTVTAARGAFTAAVVMAGTATDADGTIALVQWKEDTRVLKTTPTNGNNAQVLAASINLPIGRHVLTLRAVDDDDAATTDTVTITVNAHAQDRNNPTWIQRYLRWIRSVR